MSPSTQKLTAIIKSASQAELIGRFAQVERKFKDDGSIVTEADTAVQQRITEELYKAWPEIPLLGEEMAVERQEALLGSSDSQLWLLDPLDGTSNFAAGIPYFCVSLALVTDGKVELGVVYDPVRDECYTAQRGYGAALNGIPLERPSNLPALGSTMGLIDFKRLKPELAAKLATSPPYASQRSFGSGALDWCMIASGRCHLYLHGGQRLWDYAAGQLILSEAGGVSATLDGDAVFQNGLSARTIVAATSPELFASWQRWLRGDV